MNALDFLPKKYIAIALLLSLVLSLYSCNTKRHRKNNLLGSWNLTEVRWVSADTTYYLKKPKLGLLLITPKSYSIMWSPTQEERVPFKRLSNPTNDEIISGFRSIVFNSGRYSYTDSTLTTTSVLAKVPGFEGGKQLYNLSLAENRLSLLMFDETYPDGGKPNWAGVWKTNFLFEKIEKD